MLVQDPSQLYNLLFFLFFLISNSSFSVYHILTQACYSKGHGHLKWMRKHGHFLKEAKIMAWCCIGKMLVSKNAKICVNPNAKPKICVTPNANQWNIGCAKFSRWPCTFHSFGCRFHSRWVPFFSAIWTKGHWTCYLAILVSFSPSPFTPPPYYCSWSCSIFPHPSH